jgi:hypothetical protein
MRRVQVHIDRLVLKGVRREDRHAIAEGLRQELGRVLADREAVSILTGRGDLPRLQVRGVQFEAGSRPQAFGESVAQGIGSEVRK